MLRANGLTTTADRGNIRTFVPIDPMIATLKSPQPRARWMRLDTAQILKRFHFCERGIVVSCSAWLPHIGAIDPKTILPLFSWQNAETAHQLRERVFELRYPSREMDHEGVDKPLADLFAELQRSPSVAAFFTALATVVLPALRDVYDEFLQRSDTLADAPTHRFLALSLEEKRRQIPVIQSWADDELARNPSLRDEAIAWAEAFRERLKAIGGIDTDSVPRTLPSGPLPGGRDYSIPDKPARDERFWPCRFYWPDNVDPAYPYGEGVRLQLRSAVSHVNEVWAVETGGIILSAFASVLPWEWVHDAARWTYDEARHCRMGYDRLTAWGFDPSEIPLGTYIYESAAGADPIYRLGMLFFFETKNIGHKPVRIRAFHSLGDAASEHDMDFDWADETIHASYGKKWLQRLLETRGEDPAEYDAIREHCGELVSAMVRRAEPEEIQRLRERAEAIVAKAEKQSSPTLGAVA
jgi:uncharacterized ferritin-like protein (DUF455 family)